MRKDIPHWLRAKYSGQEVPDWELTALDAAKVVDDDRPKKARKVVAEAPETPEE